MVSLQIDDKTAMLLQELLKIHSPFFKAPKGRRYMKMRNTDLIYKALLLLQLQKVS